MIGLNDLAFGRIKTREILGAEPDLDLTKKMLKDEIRALILDLEGKSPRELMRLKDRQLMRLKDRQLQVRREINSRPGAMALPQSKIRLFSEFSAQYTDSIQQKISWQE